MRSVVAAAALVLVAGVARGDEGPTGSTIRVEVGQTVERDVGYARGLLCDDLAILDASLVTRDDHNFLRITGKQPGHTQCRAGTDPMSPPSYLFDVVVVAAKKR